MTALALLGILALIPALVVLVPYYLALNNLLGFYRIPHPGRIYFRGFPDRNESGVITQFNGYLGDRAHVFSDEMQIGTKIFRAGQVIPVKRQLSYGFWREKLGVNFSGWFTDFVYVDKSIVTWTQESNGKVIIQPQKIHTRSMWIVQRMAVFVVGMETKDSGLQVSILILYTLRAEQASDMVIEAYYEETSQMIGQTARDYFRTKKFQDARTGNHKKLTTAIESLDFERLGCSLDTLTILDIDPYGKNAERLIDADARRYEADVDLEISVKEAGVIANIGKAEADAQAQKFEAVGRSELAFAATQLPEGVLTLVLGGDKDFKLMEPTRNKASKTPTPKVPSKKTPSSQRKRPPKNQKK